MFQPKSFKKKYNFRYLLETDSDIFTLDAKQTSLLFKNDFFFYYHPLPLGV
mgnify:CR=1 FL=1